MPVKTNVRTWCHRCCTVCCVLSFLPCLPMCDQHRVSSCGRSYHQQKTEKVSEWQCVHCWKMPNRKRAGTRLGFFPQAVKRLANFSSCYVLFCCCYYVLFCSVLFCSQFLCARTKKMYVAVNICAYNLKHFLLCFWHMTNVIPKHLGHLWLVGISM